MKKILGVLLVLAIGFGLFGRGTAQTDLVQKTAADVARAVGLSWRNLDVVWRGADFSRYFVLFTDGKMAWHINGNGEVIKQRSVEEFKFSQPVLGTSVIGYSRIIEVDSQPTIVMWFYPSQLPEQIAPFFAELIAPTAVHEMFHFAEQSKPTWQGFNQLETGLRGESYPIVQDARLMRYELRLALQRAITQPAMRQTHLKAAAYWHKTWKKTYPEEYKRIFDVDIAEGTAEFFERVVSLRLTLGFSKSLAELETELITLYQKPSNRGWSFTLGAEAYELGFLAGLLLELQNNTTWQRSVMNGEATPNDILLDAIEPTPQTVAATSQTAFATSTARTEPARRAAMEPLIARYNNLNTPLLMLKATVIGSYQTLGGFALSAQLPQQVVLNVIGQFRGNNGVIGFNQSSVMLSTPKEVLQACGIETNTVLARTSNADDREVYVFLPWKAVSPDANSILPLNDFGLTGSVKITRQSKVGERTVYCGI